MLTRDWHCSLNPFQVWGPNNHLALERPDNVFEKTMEQRTLSFYGSKSVSAFQNFMRCRQPAQRAPGLAGLTWRIEEYVDDP
jgi:hypothetical protein